MGLDGVELILAVEDAFQIHIEDQEAGNVSTVGELHDLVLGKLPGRQSQRCLTSMAFYRTRRAMTDALGIDRRQIAPSTPLVSILPRTGRREAWRRIQAAMDLKLPNLRHPPGVVLAFLAIGVAVPVGSGVYARVAYVWPPVLFLIGLVIGVIAIRLTPALAVAFPTHEATVGDLARDVLANNHSQLAKQVGSWNSEEVWDCLCRIIVQQTGVAREKITRQARIVHDLGIA